MNITMFSDASVCRQSMTGAWAACGVSEDGRKFESADVLQFPFQLIEEAEAVGVWKGLTRASTEGFIAEGDEVTHYTDCKYLVECVKGTRVQPNMIHPVYAIERLQQTYGFVLTLEWIKGHHVRRYPGMPLPEDKYGASTWMHVMQNRCDLLARGLMLSNRPEFTLTSRGHVPRLDVQ